MNWCRPFVQRKPNSCPSSNATGERKPDLDALIQLSDFFDVSIDYLVDRSNIKKTSPKDEQSANDINFYNDYLSLTNNQKKHVFAFVQGLLAADNR